MWYTIQAVARAADTTERTSGRKTFEKKFEKTLEKAAELWYNNRVASMRRRDDWSLKIEQQQEYKA